VFGSIRAAQPACKSASEEQRAPSRPRFGYSAQRHADAPQGAPAALAEALRRAVTSVHPDIFKDAREARKICQQPLAQQRILDLGLQYACVWSDLQQQRGLSLRQDAD